MVAGKPERSFHRIKPICAAMHQADDWFPTYRTDLMRIAQVAPLVKPVPPILYGTKERAISYLTEELVRRGHHVTLFASGESDTEAELYSVTPHSTHLDPQHPDATALHTLELAHVFDQASRFDVIHCHLGYLPFPFLHHIQTQTVHTLHGRMNHPHWVSLMEYFPNIPVVFISKDQHRSLAGISLRRMAIIHHGLPDSLFQLGSGKGGYLAYFSRITRDKRPDLAIRASMKAGYPLKMAGRIDTADHPYFKSEIRPLLDGSSIEFLGEIQESDKIDLLQNAEALIFPSESTEPFGLIPIEAMACGTPVIVRPHGSAPETVKEGISGYVAESVEEMVEAIRKLPQIDRSRCRTHALENFSVQKMAAAYEAVYEQLLGGVRHDRPTAVD
jgi:glycosyltransferase involved in cell wall biosynthesis